MPIHEGCFSRYRRYAQFLILIICYGFCHDRGAGFTNSHILVFMSAISFLSLLGYARLAFGFVTSASVNDISPLTCKRGDKLQWFRLCSHYPPMDQTGCIVEHQVGQPQGDARPFRRCKPLEKDTADHQEKER